MKPLTADQLETMIRTAITNNHWQTVTELEPRLDQAAPPKDPVPLGSAALYYARQGLHVFPLQPCMKIPYRGTRGLHDATTDPDQIRGWWTSRPDSNIAI